METKEKDERAEQFCDALAEISASAMMLVVHKDESIEKLAKNILLNVKKILEVARGNQTH